MNNFSNRLEILIKENKTKKKDLAEAIGQTPGAITNLVKGHNNPSFQTIRSIARYYHVREEWLEYGTMPIMQGAEEKNFTPTTIVRSISPEEEELLKNLDHDPELKQVLMDVFRTSDQRQRNILLGRLEELRLAMQAIQPGLSPKQNSPDEHQHE